MGELGINEKAKQQACEDDSLKTNLLLVFEFNVWFFVFFIHYLIFFLLTIHYSELTCCKQHVTYIFFDMNNSTL